MRNLIVGNCLHENVICSCGTYQNYLCPYANIEKCPHHVTITEEMVKQWETEKRVTNYKSTL